MDPIRTHSYMTLHREAIEETRRAIQRSQQLDYQAAEQARLVTENFNRQIVEPARRAAEQWREFQSDIGERARLAIKNFDDHIGEPSRRALEQLRQFERAAFQPLLHVLREIQTNTRWELLFAARCNWSRPDRAERY